MWGWNPMLHIQGGGSGCVPMMVDGSTGGEGGCHGMTSLPLLCSPLAASDPIHPLSMPSDSTLLQLQSVLTQLVQLCHPHSQTNHGSILDPFRPGSHAKGCHLYTLSTFVLFA